MVSNMAVYDFPVQQEHYFRHAVYAVFEHVIHSSAADPPEESDVGTTDEVDGFRFERILQNCFIITV